MFVAGVRHHTPVFEDDGTAAVCRQFRVVGYENDGAPAGIQFLE